MFNTRDLNPSETAFIKQQISRTKHILLILFVIAVLIISITAFAVYVELDENNLSVNLAFGMMILLISLLYYIFKGYQKHKINPAVYTDSGLYKRIYVQHGRSGRYYDTIDGISVSIPWHWRKYLKSQKTAITYEYVYRDKQVAATEGATRYVVAVNQVLTLDYELKHGLQKAKPPSFFGALCLFLLIPVLLSLFFSNDLDKALKIQQVFKNENRMIDLNSSNDLANVTSPSYLTIKKAWVHQFKSSTDYLGHYFLIAEAERNRIYNHPNLDFYYQLVSLPNHLVKPNKQSLETALKDYYHIKNLDYKQIPDSIWNKNVEEELRRKLKIYNRNILKAIEAQKILDSLQPKNPILSLDPHTFNAPKTALYSIKKSLENPVTVTGFYDPKENTLISISNQKRLNAKIRQTFGLVSICTIIIVFAGYTLIKIISSYRIRKQLVKNQLNKSNNTKLTM